MFGKVKNWLGIEGVKVELVLPEETRAADGKINGKLRFFSLTAQEVTGIRLCMIEKFTRGRGKEKMTDEYKIGEVFFEKTFEVPAELEIEIDFTLPFQVMKSEMDQLEEKNFLAGGIVKLAKYFQGVQSEFRIEAEATVKGTALDPFDRQPVQLV